MPLMRLRVTGSDDDVRAIANLLTSLDGIEQKKNHDPSFRSPAALGSLFFARTKKSNPKKVRASPTQSHDRKAKGRVRDSPSMAQRSPPHILCGARWG